MCVLLYCAYIVVCCAKRFLLMSDSQKAFLYHTVTFNITGNWFHPSSYLLVIVKWMYTLVTVQIPHGLVTLTSSIQDFNLPLWVLSKAILYGCHSPKTDRTEQTVSKRDACRTQCIHLFIPLWFLPVLYSCTVQSNHDLYISTFYFLSKLIAMCCGF